MEQETNKYGLLLNNNIKLHRQYFDEMVKLLGIQVLYYRPKSDKHYTTYTELKSNYFEPKIVGCIFNEHPNQYTLRKLGWVSELSDKSSLISVPYNLEGIQQGALFAIPSGIDEGEARIFRVVSISNIMIYPSSITCEIVPEYTNTYNESQNDYSHKSFTSLSREDDEI